MELTGNEKASEAVESLIGLVDRLPLAEADKADVAQHLNMLLFGLQELESSQETMRQHIDQLIRLVDPKARR